MHKESLTDGSEIRYSWRDLDLAIPTRNSQMPPVPKAPQVITAMIVGSDKDVIDIEEELLTQSSQFRWL